RTTALARPYQLHRYTHTHTCPHYSTRKDIPAAQVHTHHTHTHTHTQTHTHKIYHIDKQTKETHLKSTVKHYGRPTTSLLPTDESHTQPLTHTHTHTHNT